MSDKHRREGHEIKGLDSEKKNIFSNESSKFHVRIGQARLNSKLLDVLAGCVAPSNIMYDSVLKTSIRYLCNQVTTRSKAV